VTEEPTPTEPAQPTVGASSIKANNYDQGYDHKEHGGGYDHGYSNQVRRPVARDHGMQRARPGQCGMPVCGRAAPTP